VYALETALFLHGLTDRTPDRFCMTFPAGYNTGALRQELVRTNRVKTELHGLGVAEMKSPGGHSIRVYDAERTLCDILKGGAERMRMSFPTPSSDMSGAGTKHSPPFGLCEASAGGRQGPGLSGGVVVKRAMQLKARMKQVAREKGISAQLAFRTTCWSACWNASRCRHIGGTSSSRAAC
jgi:hypothetical protein